jgi:hypothetical protein
MQNEQAPVYATGTGAIQHPPEAYINDKSTYANSQGQPLQQQQGQFPQQQYQQQYPQQQQQHPQQQQFVGQYPNAIPLASLQQVPALIDCPLCRVRQMTIVHEETGGYTQ